MNKRIVKLEVCLFRGLYNYNVDLNGNLLIFAKNGGGKSSIVQALEWLFSGRVENIDDNALRHIHASDDTSFVKIILSDSESVRKSISVDSVVKVSGGAIDYIESHPSVESFILRRTRLLDFIFATPSDRYKKVMSLIGLEWLNGVQASLQEASDCTAKSLRNLRIECDSILQKYHGIYGRANSVGGIVAICSSLLQEEGLGGAENVSAITVAMEELSKKRSPENYVLLTNVERCLDLLSTFDPDNLVKRVSSLNALRQKVRELSNDIAEKDIFRTLAEVGAYFQRNESMYACPVCERPFDDSCSYFHVKENVEKRLDLMKEMSALMKENDELTKSLETLVFKVNTLCKSCVRDIHSVLKIATKEIERDYVVVAGIQDESGKISLGDCIIDPYYFEVCGIMLFGLEKLSAIKKELTAHSPMALEKLFSFLSVAFNDINAGYVLEEKIKKHEKLSSIAAKVLSAFKSSRKKAFESLMSTIADDVKKYYEYIHVDDDRCEVSECSDVVFSMDNRGRGLGNIHFLTSFFDTVKDCKPEQYLSEGHMDSLGLCIYLASVKKFNPPGSLLILDDVLTSIDREHRHRITDLLVNEFKEYQLIVTTHDELWFDQLKHRVKNSAPDSWNIREYDSWTLDKGPSLNKNNDILARIKKDLQTGQLANCGGPLRIITEGFCQKTAEAVNLKMPYNVRGEYTLPIFVDSKLGDKLKSVIEKKFNRDERELAALVPLADEQKSAIFEKKQRITDGIDKVLSSTFINKLVHRKPNLEGVTDGELRSFAESLLFVYEECCGGKFLNSLRQLA
jgi:energy-coupling factor transporter ATP-binding protein EcfA2